jgi:hypothetical protein
VDKEDADRMKEEIEANYKQIKSDIVLVIENEMDVSKMTLICNICKNIISKWAR